jgi:hypothetical protein
MLPLRRFLRALFMQLLGMVESVARLLTVLHGSGRVHRDFKCAFCYSSGVNLCLLCVCAAAARPRTFENA